MYYKEKWDREWYREYYNGIKDVTNNSECLS